MVSAIDRGNALLLTKEDFNRAMSWLIEAEQDMPKIFQNTTESSDSVIMDETVHMIQTKGGVIEEGTLIRYLRQRVPSHAVMRVVEIMERSGLIIEVSRTRFGVRSFGVGALNG